MSTVSKAIEAVAFFAEHAGYSFNPLRGQTAEQGRQQTAHTLANAERWAEINGHRFVWSDDWAIGSHRDYFGADSAYADSEPDTCESCVLVTSAGDILGSLGCIDDASDDYRRVVQAEIAAEAMTEAHVAEGEQALAIRDAAAARAASVGVQDIPLNGWTHNPTDAGIPQLVYGELLRVALPVVRHYLSDLYHDALWLSQNITDDSVVTFYYAVRESGTHLVMWADNAAAVKDVNPDSVVYAAAIVCDARGAWTLALSRCDAMGGAA